MLDILHHKDSAETVVSVFALSSAFLLPLPLAGSIYSNFLESSVNVMGPYDKPGTEIRVNSKLQNLPRLSNSRSSLRQIDHLLSYLAGLGLRATNTHALDLVSLVGLSERIKESGV